MKRFTALTAIIAIACILGAVAPLPQTALARHQQAVNQLDDEAVKNLPIPVLFGVSLISITPDFGDPRSGGREHEGQDILAPRGTPIVSPTEAVVLSEGVWTGAGNYVSTANPGGENFRYMHLDQPSHLKSGDVLKVGDLIGFVGNTGNASGGATHLHLEIRKSGATDPYPRLTREFTLKERMSFTERMLDDSNDAEELAQFLVRTYPAQFQAAQAADIDLPWDIAVELERAKKAGLVGAAAPAALAGGVPARDLQLGARGTDVIWLQIFLINAKSGAAAQKLTAAGATSYFGLITQAALAEYQFKAGIAPAAGYFGPLTRARLTAIVAAN